MGHQGIKATQTILLLVDIGLPITAELGLDIVYNPLLADRGGIGAAGKGGALRRHRVPGTREEGRAAGQTGKRHRADERRRRPGVSALGKGGTGLAVNRHGGIPSMVGGRLPGLCPTNLILP